ncbi:copper resistance system multicopper oxidase [Hyphococcus sp.]|jgi:FtsP/CotA-like multicopper oxidase with cupredoxin domain|uniref:copper resistance system multicopper oxidase n=1 Tax=Hyphococcus sp. TaxID=2038636 RepID=UPI003D1057BB
MLTRRHLLHGAAAGGFYAGAAGLLPAWAQSGHGDHDMRKSPAALTGPDFDLTIGHADVLIGGRKGHAVTVNGTLPAPLIRFREGENVILRVTNTLEEDTSIHWHGLLVPFYMDGVPGVSFPGIKPGETFTYEFAVPQNGTYWYHSHSGLQEQSGLYGPLIVDPAGADPISYDREYVLVLSDWLFEHPHKVFAKLKKNNEVFNMQERTLGDFIRDAGEDGLDATIADRAMWGRMRMSATDIADVTGAVYTYLINGHSTEDNWTALFETGERIRLRIINAAAMTIFNFRIPGLPMTVVQADGLHVRPVDTDEFQIGVAETYDVIVEPKRARPFAIVAESIDRSGQAVATLAPRPDMRATAPLLRDRPILTHKDMAMDHGSMSDMDHGSHEMPKQEHHHKRGVGVDMVAAMPTNRLDEPGLGLENVPHRALRYTQLQSLDPNPDTRTPGREIEIHLTGNMERFMWSFDGVKFSAIEKPITLYEGERARFTLVNDTMMTHPIHLHGMFFDLITDDGEHRPRKHTVNVKPGEKLSFDVTADHVGDWAFHCHLLFHMHAGMMQVVSVLPKDKGASPSTAHEGHDMKSGEPAHGAHDHGEH